LSEVENHRKAEWQTINAYKLAHIAHEAEKTSAKQEVRAFLRNFEDINLTELSVAVASNSHNQTTP